MTARHALTSAPILPTIWRLSLPNMFAMVATALVSIAETTYVGRLGTLELAGIALVFPLLMLQQMLSAGSMGGGISSAISRAIGAGDDARANALVLHAAVISAALALFFTVVFLLFGEAIFRLVGGQGEALKQALRYSDVAFAGSISIWLTNAFASAIRASGNMKTPSVTLLLVSVGQIIFGGALGLGLGPLPRLGMAGIAMGQVIAFTLGGLYLYHYLRSPHSRVRLSFATRLEGRNFREILKVGAIASISSVQTVLTILVLTRIIASFGTEALAGYGIGTRLEFLLIPITFAIGVACVPMVGMAIGSGMVQRARKVAWTGAALSAGIVGLLGLVVALWPDLWAASFSNNPQVLEFARSYLRWAAPCYAFFGFGLCLYFASQGAGKLIGPVFAGTLRLGLVWGGGLALVATGAPAWNMFALVGLAMVVYGVATGWFTWRARWGSRAAA
jgi:putative MATE family efflux protein